MKGVQVAARQPGNNGIGTNQPVAPIQDKALNGGNAQHEIQGGPGISQAAPASGVTDTMPGHNSNGSKSSTGTVRGSEGAESRNDITPFLGWLLDDNEAYTFSPEAVLDPFLKKPDAKNAEGLDGLWAMIPGLDSPTLEAWDAGKYKGKEGQALDDALEDPKLWRLAFSLSGM